ncbi:hypothetical protein PCC79_01605 [Propioniciclava soli]|uniref:MmyB-like transcription regulator ligand binding domain-containing protein n=1 Tax=Propioniciclava soli TaxID=2775081 RepID=A0ABZ3C817_9ACTN
MRRPNVARFVFLDPAAPEFFTDWDEVADASAALLRTLGGQYPHDRGLHDLVGELSTRSDAFAQRWAAHNVRQHRTGTKRIHHPVVGSLTLSYEAMTLTADEGLTLNAYMAEPGTADAQALGLLASWVGNQASDPVAAEAG